MIDLHCHLCFGVDDGPKTPQEAAALARALVGAGVTEVACTPHIRPDKGWMCTEPTQAELHARLDDVLDGAGASLVRHRGAEHYFDAEVFEEPLGGKVVPYAESRWLLVELPYQGPPPDLFGPLFRLRQKGYRVLLAHLERYPYVVDDRAVVERLVSGGYLVQVNLGSLAGAYARAHKKAAERLVGEGLAAICAGDCHRAKDVKACVEKGLKALTKLVGDEQARRLTEENPRRILDDRAPDEIWP